MGQAQLAVAIELGQGILEFGNRIPRSLREHLHAEFGTERRNACFGNVATAIGNPFADCKSGDCCGSANTLTSR